MRPLALKWRLSVPMAVALAAVIIAICAIVYAETREFCRKQTDRSLLALARAADDVASDATDPSGLSTKLSVLFPAPGRHADMVARIWREDTGQVIHVVPASGIHWDKTLANLSKPADGQSRAFSVSLAGHDYRGVWLRPAQGHFSIVIAQATANVESELRELLRDLVWIGAGVIAAMVAVVVLLVHVGLRPIRLAASHLRNVDARSLPNVDLESRSVPNELAPFVDALVQMLHRLKEAMRRQKAFVADASHELRTPVTAAKSTIQTTLAARRSEADYRQSLEEALDDLRRMEHLVDELLLLARLDEASDTPQDQPIPIDPLLAELADSFRERVSQAGGKLVCSLSSAVVAGDDRQLVRLFSNLLDNALRHGPKGGTIYLTAGAEADRVVVVVQDEGGNIPAEAIPRLFERFFRADGSRASSTGGSGLGLAIAREIVVRHGGTIEITSQPADGTKVIVALPLLTVSKNGRPDGGRT